MIRDPSKEPLSKAQVRFLDENVPAFLAWAGMIGMKVEPWQRRIVAALIRKDVLTNQLSITDSGKKAWMRQVDKMKRKQAA